MYFSTQAKTVFAFMFMFVLVLAGCDSDDPDDVGSGEEELITRATITLSPMGGGDDVVVSANDPDGDGTNFTIDQVDLLVNTTYTGSITFTDEINNEDITEEIEEEDEEHQIFYLPGGDLASRITVTYNDQDENGLPIGLDFTLVVSDGAAASGTMRVVLSHYDEGPKDGENLSDESDIDVTFPVEVSLP